MADEIIDKPTYGVWIPGKGWVRSGALNAPFTDAKFEVAEQLARRLHHRAQVYYIDNALFDMEDQLLIAERERSILWRISQWFRKLRNNALST